MTSPTRNAATESHEAATAPGALAEDGGRLQRVEEELLQASQELSRLHRELEGLRERVRSEQAEREELLSVVSHELRTPVTVIGGFSRLLLAEQVGPLNDDQRRFLEESRRGCERLDRFIENLLQASHAARGDLPLELGRFSVAPVVHGVAAMFRPILAENELRLVVDLDSDAGTARFDRTRIEQVLTNLVGNAVKYTPPAGSIELHTRAIERPDDPWVKRWVEISVTDDGPGIPVPDRTRVFEPYVQAGEGRGAGGLGLGLSICKRLVEAHGGEIHLEEPDGGGCRFRFTVPAEVPADALAEGDAS